MKTRLNVLMLALNSSIGGTEQMILSLLRHLNKERFNCTLCTLVGDGTLVAEARRSGIRAVDLRMRGPLDLRIVGKLKALIKDGRVDILHTYLYHANILGRIMGRFLDVPAVISTQRSTDNWRLFYHRLIDRWTAGMADVIISNSLAGKRRLVQIEKIPDDKIKVIYNGIEVNAAAAEKRGAALRRSLGIAEGAPVIVTVANLKHSKGLSYLVRAMPHVVRFYPEVKLVVVGYGPLKTELEDLAKELGVGKSVIWAGYQSDAVGHISFCDIFVLPSLWEGTPVALMEAMALGKPVIATEVGGVAEIVDHFRNGFLIPPRDTVWLYEAVLTLLSNPLLRRRFGQKAREKIEKDFPLHTMVRETEELYLRLGNYR